MISPRESLKKFKNLLTNARAGLVDYLSAMPEWNTIWTYPWMPSVAPRFLRIGDVLLFTDSTNMRFVISVP